MAVIGRWVFESCHVLELYTDFVVEKVIASKSQQENVFHAGAEILISFDYVTTLKTSSSY